MSTVLLGTVAAQASNTVPAAARIAHTWGVDGRVLAQVPIGDSVVIGGDFTSVTGPDGELRPAKHVAIYNATTGTFTNTSFDFDGSVESLAVSGDTLYAVGKFKKVAGQSMKFLAAVSLTTGQPVPGFTAKVDKAPSMAYADGGWLYIGGKFTTVTDSAGAHPRTFVARLSSSTGLLNSAFAPAVNDVVYAALATADHAQIYLAGDFTTIGGSAVYNRIARVSASTGTPDPSFSVGPTNLNARAPIRTIATNGSALLLSTLGSGGACALVTASTGQLLWSKHGNGDMVAADFMGPYAYCAGHFSGPGAFDGLERQKVAAVDVATGTTQSWAPVVNSALGVFSMSIGANALYIGGDFTKVDTVDQSHFGQFRAVDALTAPAAVASLDVEAGDSQVVLSWPTPSTDGGSALQPYRIYRSNGGATNLVGQTADRSFTDTTATNGVTYTYYVVARSAAGDASPSPQATATPVPDGIVAPTAPTNLVATGQLNTSRLTWSAPTSNGGSPITAYNVYRRVVGQQRQLYATVSGQTTSYVDSAVDVGTRYYYTVSAVNAVGEGAQSVEASAVPNNGVPTAPVLSLVSNDANGVSLEWTVPTYSAGPILKYILVRDLVKITNPSPTMLSFVDTTGVSGQTYTYQVRATNSYGTSKWSNTIVVTIG